MCKIDCSGGCRDCAPDEHPKYVQDIKVGDTIWLKGWNQGMEVVDYGLNKEGWFICYRPKVTSFALLDQISGWTDPETGKIKEVDISEVPKPPEEALENF